MNLTTTAEALSVEDADHLLADLPLLSVLSGSIIDMKRVRAQLLEAGIPVRMGCPGGGSSCGPKSHLLVAEANVQDVARVMQSDWLSAMDREGIAPVGPAPKVMPGFEDELPCPACGTAAPLIAGSCSDCGLHLE